MVALYSEERIRNKCGALAKNVNAPTQKRMSDFFMAKPSTKPAAKPDAKSDAKPKRGKRDRDEVRLYKLLTVECSNHVFFLYKSEDQEKRKKKSKTRK